MKKYKLKKIFEIEVILAKIYYPAMVVVSYALAFFLLLKVGINDSLTVMLITYTIPGIMCFFSTINLFRYIYCLGGVKYTERKILSDCKSNYIIIYQGEPGTGKSSLNNYSGVIIAKEQWSQLKVEYALLVPFREEILNGYNEEKKKHFLEVEKAFTFWAKHEKSIPCLRTNVPIKDEYGRFSEILKKEHLEQKEPLAYRDTVIQDEFGAEFMADNKKGEAKNLAFSDQFRFTRQFTETHIGGTEQDAGNIAIDGRRCVAINRKMQRQQAVLKPLLITWFYNFNCKFLISNFKDICADNFEEKVAKAQRVSKRYISFLVFLLRFIKACGFRKYRYSDRANLITGGNVQDKVGNGQEEIRKGIAYAPSLLNCRYNDRCFMEAYQAKDKPLKSNRWKSLIIEDEEVLKNFMRNKKAYKSRD